MAFVAGIDGCRAGWLAVLLDPDGGGSECAIARRWRELPLAGARMAAVDMPIGLSEAGPRACDVEARRLLPRGRISSVFAPPRRAMLDCRSWAEANALGKAREGRGLSRQAWNITARIRELDRALGPADQDRVREAHPELVFHRLNAFATEVDSRRPVPPKRSAAGRAARLVLLGSAGVRGLEALIARLPRAQARPDDLLDAAACALAARDMLRGVATRLPADPPRDARGLRMEIWF